MRCSCSRTAKRCCGLSPNSHPTCILPQDIAEEGGGAESVIASYDTMGPGALQLALRALDRNIKKLQKAKPEKHAPIREQVTSSLACTRRHDVHSNAVAMDGALCASGWTDSNHRHSIQTIPPVDVKILHLTI